jgi:hypothetical protein
MGDKIASLCPRRHNKIAPPAVKSAAGIANQRARDMLGEGKRFESAIEYAWLTLYDTFQLISARHPNPQ